MSVFSDGCADVRSSGRPSSRAGVGAIFDDAPATHHWQANMKTAADKLRSKYAGAGPFPVADMLADLNHWWNVATQFASEAPTLDGIRPDQVTKAKNNAVDLLEARAALKLAHPAGSVPKADADELVRRMVAPIEWLVSVGTPVLSSDEKTRSSLKTFLWIGAAIGGVWALTRLFDSTANLKREVMGDRTIIPPRALVRNPPAWAVDAELYETARVAVRDSGEHYDNPKMVITHVYKQLGGRVG